MLIARVCSWLITKIAIFFGVADLTDQKRAKFIEKWLSRAQKMHDDDLLLTLCKRRPDKLDGPPPKREAALRTEASRDITDAPCV